MRTALLLLGLFLLGGCAGRTGSIVTPPAGTGDGGKAMQLTSTAFSEGGTIPSQYTCDGEDLSPPLAWAGAPAGTQAFALICDDPDAPAGTWVHWVLFNLPGAAASLPQGVPPDKTLAGGGVHGTNSWRRIGYGGPCPPSGTHRYFFKLYALDTMLNLGNNATAKDVQAAIKGHVLAEAQLMGRYARTR